MVAVENDIFFAPMKSKNIWRYNLISDKWKKYELKAIDGFEGYPDIFQAFILGEKIYFFSFSTILVRQFPDTPLNTGVPEHLFHF